jgi:hypothetical protein
MYEDVLGLKIFMEMTVSWLQELRQEMDRRGGVYVCSSSQIAIVYSDKSFLKLTGYIKHSIDVRSFDLNLTASPPPQTYPDTHTHTQPARNPSFPFPNPTPNCLLARNF